MIKKDKPYIQHDEKLKKLSFNEHVKIVEYEEIDLSYGLYKGDCHICSGEFEYTKAWDSDFWNI